ncbi:MAG: ribonuclease R, partial [Pseudomonadales bacterium]|nr:ribonuclease R [Pseudomonadales bacterium]
RISHEIYLQPEAGEQPVEGQIVVARILRQPGEHSHVLAAVSEVLGDHLTPDIEVEIALRNNDIPAVWPEEVVAEAQQLPDQVSGPDKNRRKDLREVPFVTIDGADARDFDDAVYCEARAGGGWRLYVAIADVAHYVTVGSALDKSAYARGTSVYFPQYVVPMLPEKLSNGLCSLNPQVDRLVMVCEMTISARGRIGSYQFYEGVIHSAARLTYPQVAELLEGDAAEFLYPALTDPLLRLYDLYKTLDVARRERHALEFESTELGFAFTDSGDVENIFPTTRNVAHKVIEECMLCANVCAARFISKHEAPGLFRVHEPPDVSALEQLAEFLGRFGIKVQKDVAPETADYQQILAQLRRQPNGHILQMAVLRSLNQAVYQPENRGHFGLGYKEYTHFTSPIRRYPDLLVHRYIKQIIHSKAESKYVQRFGRSRVKAAFYPYDLPEVVAMGEHTSFAERRADSAVYEVLEWIKCNYVNQHLGEIVDAVITGVARFGFFAELTGVYVEGLVHVSSLTGDYYQYDQSSQTLIGERSGVHYGMGDPVRVQVVRVDIDERKIDLELISHSALTRRRKTRATAAKGKSGDGAKSSRKGRGSERRKSRSKAGSKEKVGKKVKVSSERKKASKKTGPGRNKQGG